MCSSRLRKLTLRRRLLTMNSPKEYYEFHVANYKNHIPWDDLSIETKQYWITEYTKRYGHNL